ncbi:trehalose-phosphatase [Acaricomes phytoseiuli]|uniref:trehalose-phosphatase n=1 Tax=Acaricomes phytoseiuli TaxID=291968 RepID=UPI0003796E5E|nr:trehalose-phosphatase [Acaricomes phytoseiuli]MCW1250203.1 trehalose-phosphatase [Acaricomes phytoseiuli]
MNNAQSLTGLDPALYQALVQLSRTERLLVACDFDGALAPFVPRAEDARPLPASAQALTELADTPRTTTALISGRALSSLRAVAEPSPRTLLIGSHGAERWLGSEPAGQELPSLSAEDQDLLSQVVTELSAVSTGHPGTSIEVKPAGAVLHTRQADDDVAEAAVLAARSALRPLGVRLQNGKRVLEASVLQVDKGQGLDLLREFSAATGVFFVGDDATDEDGFRTLRSGEVGVKVGPEETAAEYRVDSPEQVATVLTTLLDLRIAAVSDLP